MNQTTISAAEMARHIAAGRARPLLPEGVPGPVQHASRWWAIPTGGQDYQPVTNPATITQLDTDAQRFHRARLAARAVTDRDGTR
jgi:hypothetical protein